VILRRRAVTMGLAVGSTLKLAFDRRYAGLPLPRRLKTAAEVEDLIAVRAGPVLRSQRLHGNRWGFVTFRLLSQWAGITAMAVDIRSCWTVGAGHWSVGRGLMPNAFDAAAHRGRRIMVAPSAGQSGAVAGFIPHLALPRGQDARIGQKERAAA